MPPKDILTADDGGAVPCVGVSHLVEQEVMGKASTNKNKWSSVEGDEKATTIGLMTRKKVLEVANPDSKLLIIISGRVYDCTHWQWNHPGGHLLLRALCGKDTTDPFLNTHIAEGSLKMLKRFHVADIVGDDDDEHLDEATIAFRKLTAQLKRDGWYKPDMWFYYRKLPFFVCLFGAVVYGVLYSQSLLVHALSGLGLGVFWQQLAFWGHDLGHNAVTHDRARDCDMGLIVGNLMTGISIGWWKRSHNVHHIVTNSCEHDPDIQHLPVFAINPLFLTTFMRSTFYDADMQLDRWAHLLVRYQHYLYFPVMCVARFNLYFQAMAHALGIGVYSREEKLWRRNLQILSLVGFFGWLFGLTLFLPTWTSRFVFLGLSHALAGILHVQITLSHFCMHSYSGVTYDNAENGFLRTQLMTTLDIDCPCWMDWFHGGLQFQAVHHLWPRIPRCRLRRLKGILESFCATHGLDYHQEPFFRATGIMLTKLREVGETTQDFSELFVDSMLLQG